jgi:hypothetical protein
MMTSLMGTEIRLKMESTVKTLAEVRLYCPLIAE